MSQYYEWIKVIHIIAVISWMAGMLYLPRLYVYHTRVAVGSETDKIFQEMERKLLRVIINPAMIISIVFGLLLAYIYGFVALGIWFHIKMAAVVFLTTFHGLLARWRRNFVAGNNKYSEKFFRVMNEVPTILMIVAVIMVIVKPFE